MTHVSSAEPGSGESRRTFIAASEISGASVASLVLTIGWNIGTDSLPGKICIWSAPWLVLVLPLVISTMINVIDDALKHWQYERQRKRLYSMVAKAGYDAALQKKLMKQIEAADVEHAARILQRMRSADPEVSGS
ncbi:hypothetical protein ACGFNY_13425 [Streptomyces chartreusis]|uniref:hypothetical protein n=1 Tax=Streptomyces chartreusis TaxID=1969 RepID=UPI00371A065C